MRLAAYKSWAVHITKLMVSLLLVAGLLYYTDVHAVFGVVKDAHLGWLLGATCVVFLGVVVIQAYEIYRSIPAALRPSPLALGQVNLAMMFYAFFLPTALTFAIRWTKYRALGLEGAHSAALVGVHKLLQLTVALVFFVVGYFTIPVAAHPAIEAMMWGLVALLFLLVAYFSWLALSPSLRSLLPSVRFSWRSRVKGRAGSLISKGAHLVSKLGGALMMFQHLSGNDKARCLAFALLQHLCIITSAYWVLVAIEPGTSWLAVMVVRSLLVVLLMVPISVAGMGVRELVFFALLPFYGVSAETAIAASLLLLGIQLFIALLGASSELYQQWRKTRSISKATNE